MAQSIDLLQRVYDATNSGLDIITDLLPAVDDAVINRKKAFRLRPGERTPSAHLYPPKDGCGFWHVKDFGMGEGGGYFSPIDLYMWEKGYGQGQFRMALEELAERYGVQDRLSPSADKPVIEQREARPDETGAEPRITLCEDFQGTGLSCWGKDVKPEHLQTYGWKAVSEVSVTCGGKVVTRRATPAYPIFAQQCDYVDAQGQPQTFFKVYEPKNPDKARRFLIVGKKPQDYIYGLNAVRKTFQEQGEEKLPVLLLVSGGSDAVCALVNGYLSVWLDSEVKGLSGAAYLLLRKYCHRLVNIPDIDHTGIRAGQRLALGIPDICTAWLNEDDLGGLHDNRGRRCKDLRDYCRLHPGKDAMQLLVNRALRARFWTAGTDRQGRTEYTLSRTSLDYFLELNGFCTVHDDREKEPVYVRIEGVRVRRIRAKSIVVFLKRWMEQQGLSKALQDKVLRSRDLPTNASSTLRERDDLDFTRATATSQRYYFRDGVVDVTADRITRTPYSMVAPDRYVWEDSVIPHSFRQMKQQFSVTKGEDGRYHITVAEDAPSKLFRFVRNASRLYWRKQDEGGLELTPEEKADEEQALIAKVTNIGYLLHGYKAESMAWATVCQDSTLGETEDECNGRSGKSFYIKALQTLLNTFYIEARTPSVTDNRFLFDGVTADTDLVIVDECHLRLDFDFFFGKITGPFRGEEKGNHPFLIPFAQSPKLAFGTNYVLRRHDPSTEGRLWPQVFSDYYHVRTVGNGYRETRTIRDDFGENLMGADYAEADWQADIAFLLECLQTYLSLPEADRRQMPPLKQVERREQMAAVGKEFRQWADEYFAEGSGNLDRDLKADQVLADFNQETKFGWAPRRMTQHLRDYCRLADHIRCLNPASVTHKKDDGERWVKRDESGQQKTYYFVQSAKAADEAAKTNPESVQTEIQF